MKLLLTKHLKAKAVKYQVKRFGNYIPPKPLSKAIAKTLNP